MGGKEKEEVLQKERGADTVGGGDDRQIQGEERKRMLFGRTKSRHDYLECTAKDK